MYITRVYVWKETHTCDKGLTNEKRLTHMKRDHMYVRDTYICMERNPCRCQGTDIWKETYTYEKRLTHMKRDLHIWKETYTYEKRLTHMKRGLYVCM